MTNNLGNHMWVVVVLLFYQLSKYILTFMLSLQENEDAVIPSVGYAISSRITFCSFMKYSFCMLPYLKGQTF